MAAHDLLCPTTTITELSPNNEGLKTFPNNNECNTFQFMTIRLHDLDIFYSSFNHNFQNISHIMTINKVNKLCES